MISTGNNIAVLNGLVLAGGKSKRMGRDKSLIQWHGKEQHYYVADMLQSVCQEVFISCRAEQEAEIDAHYKTLADTYTGIGPYGAILTAFSARPGAAWLVVACDLPLLDIATVQYLLAQRDTSFLASAFESPYDGLPEPLITIWEPGSADVLLVHLNEGLTCPRKVLIRNSEKVKLLNAPNPEALMNTNTAEDAEKVKALIQQKTAVL